VGHPAYKQRLLADGTAAIAELGFTGRGGGDKMVVYENTAPIATCLGVHNVVVCTLCSCYPWIVLGLPPVWYKAPPIARRGPRARKVLGRVRRGAASGDRDQGLGSSAEIRYMVLPLRPEGTEHVGAGAGGLVSVTR